MNHRGTIQARRVRLLLIYVVLLAPAVFYGASQAMRSNANSPLDWVSGDFAPRARYDEFTERFGPGDTVIASWDGCTIDQPALDQLTRELRHSPVFYDADRWQFDRVTSGREIALMMAANSANLTRDELTRRLSGSMIGPDGATTYVVITFTPQALPRRREIVQQIQACITRVCGVPAAEQHLAGPVIDGLSVDEAGQASLARLAIPSALAVLLLACVCLRSIRVGAIVFGFSIFCQAATLALIYYSGETMSALLIVLPPLVQVLAVAGGIHLSNYYFESLASNHDAADAPWQAVRIGWLPCLLSAGTTALGIGSLLVSHLTPIRLFGAYGAAGVILTAGLLLALVPALLAVGARRAYRTGASRRRRRRPRQSPVTWRIWNTLTHVEARCASAIVAASLVLLVVGGYGVRYLKTSVRIDTLFPPDHRILADYRWLEAHVGRLVPIEVVVTYPADDRSPLAQRIEQVDDLQTALANSPEVSGTFSALQLLPDSPAPAFPASMRMGQQPTDAPRAAASILAAAPEAWSDAGLVKSDDDGQHWRVSAYVSALGEMDYGRFLDQLQARVGAKTNLPPGVDVTYTGIMPLVHEIQHQLMRDLLVSFLGALVLIYVVMSLTQAGFAAGAVAMLPNVFPVVVLFGLLGWAGAPLDIGTVMTASLALGVAVDDTLHFLTFFARGIAGGLTRPDAVLHAYRHCAAAMMQTTLISGLGMIPFAASDFLPTSRFAWMTAALLAAALAGDLFILPGCLLSPLGRLFVASDSRAETTPPRPSIDDDQAETARTASDEARALIRPRRRSRRVTMRQIEEPI